MTLAAFILAALALLLALVSLLWRGGPANPAPAWAPGITTVALVLVCVAVCLIAYPAWVHA